MVDNHAPLSVKGKLMPLDREMLTEIGLSLANLDMTRLTPYTLKHIAYPVSTGQFSTDIKLGLKGKALDMDNLLRFHRFELGDKVDNPDAPSLPIKLGLALLSDRDGNMELDVPVQGRLDDPQFKLGKVIMGAIFNLIGKIITSPFALIGGMFGGGEDVNTLEFDPGTTALTPEAQAKAESVAKALAERPRLKLEITGFADPASDGPALHEAAFQALLRAQKAQALRKDGQAVPEQVVVSAEEYPRYLLAAYENAEFKRPRNFLGMLKDQPAEEMERMLREHVAVEPSRVTDLAGLRAQAVREAILSRQGVAADRVFLRNAPQGGKAQPGRRVELGLK
jgi:hypothetical protein